MALFLVQHGLSLPKEKLVSYLTTGSVDILVYRFQNSGIVCLDQEDNGWYIKWTLNPNIG